ncbi:GTP-binding protein 1 [Neolecta irregularis DAH-3]|uniref:GTP-binding protein 1 n=1 Tax=Neolecta irregularis (strain DAH-3) TaxID=1198029 RepID=A0A1U7LWA7_NEOID|nr:GTP-binding protein 1 [Neolecta irregularis DAH-3]|eukprot:OLL26909.1 GTP-binding protein 1 [Neolecta irregularis DAH-3]
MGITEKIKEIEIEMARTQKNKATEYHLGLLKAKLARYRAQLLEPAAGSGKSPGEGFYVRMSGDARVAFIGFPEIDIIVKSTLSFSADSEIFQLTKTKSEVASYEFTTLTAIPGVIEYDGAEIQALDLPGIIQGASEGKGRGRQVIAAAKTADLILIVLDCAKSRDQRRLLEIKTGGGITFNATCKLTHIDERTVQGILREYQIHNANVLIREDVTLDDFVDVILESHRKYIKCLYVYNKIDCISLEEVDRLAREPNTVVISCEWSLNLDYLLDRIWDELGLLRIYTKKRGQYPDFKEALIVRDNSTVEDVCHAIHRNIAENFKTCYVWGRSAKHQPQRVGLNFPVADEDVISIITK